MPPHVESLSNHDDDVIHPPPSTVDDDISSPSSNSHTHTHANSNANPNDANAPRSAGVVEPITPQSLEYPSPLFRDEDELLFPSNHLGGTSSRCRLDRKQSNGTNDDDDDDDDEEERPAGPTKATGAAPPMFVSKISQILGPESKYIPSDPSSSPCPSHTAGKNSRDDSTETKRSSAAETDRAAGVAPVAETGQPTLAVSSLGRTSSQSCNEENSKDDVSTENEPSEAKGENETSQSLVPSAATNSANQEDNNRDECDDGHDDNMNSPKNCTVEFLVLPPQLILRATRTVSKRGWKALKFVGGSGTRLVGTVFAAGVGGGRSEC